MTAVHLHPHPMAGKYVTPSNAQIKAKFGNVRVEDWADRIQQDTWISLASRHQQDAEAYQQRASDLGAPISGDNRYAVVYCHTQVTGEVVLLHDDWIKDGTLLS